MVHKSTTLKCLLLYLTFVIYGSLVPLEFQMLPFDQALETFRNISYLDLGIHSRADWVANILLFIPLAFLFNGYLWLKHGSRRRLLSSLIVVALCLILSTGIEFIQLYFPQRTVSQNDIAAEGIGAIIGVFIWWFLGERFLLWLSQWQDNHSLSSISQRLLLLYLAVIYGYNLLPLDLTISPVEIYRSWREGRIILIPFSSLSSNWVENLYHLTVDGIIWAPISFLLLATTKRSTLNAWGLTLSAALLLEIMQLFVYSRTADVTDLITAAIGATIGAILWRISKKHWTQSATKNPLQSERIDTHPLLIAGILFTVWTTILGIVFWYPYNFNTDRTYILEAVSTLKQVPFHAYYYGTEFRAITEVFHKILFFMPYGILSVIIFHTNKAGISPQSIRLLTLVAGAFAGLMIESGQLLIPGKHADITDLMLKILGVLLGYWGASIVANSMRKQHKEAYQSQPNSNHETTPLKKHTLTQPFIAMFLGMAGMIITGTIALTSTGIPYNIRELFSGGSQLLGLTSLSVAFYWGLGIPAYLGRWLMGEGKEKRKIITFPLLIICHASLMYLFIRIAVPIESIHDILGYPILHWPWEWELLSRFIALFGAISLLLSCAAAIWISLSPFYSVRNRGGMRWLITAFLLLPLSHWVVAEQASTDNLTELMLYQGSWLSSMLIAIWIIILGTAASLLSASFAKFFPSRVLSIIIALFSILPAYLALYLGTESAIQKYGTTFSALQFLLSTDRLHMSDGINLFIRYAIAQITLMGIIALAQLPVWMFLANQRNKWELYRRLPENRDRSEEQPF
ncbi:MAG: VanZ family protein [Candidatus Polarisedimenticolaceae bacterium]|nr:VanZ family protein [Candidatus Polarisedimenticolaceae bacterium]